MSAAGRTQSLSGLLNIPSVVVGFLSGLLDILSWYHTSVRYHLSVTSNILPILCSIHTRLGTWHLIHCTIIFGMLFLYGTWYFMKWKKSCLSHMPSLPHQSLISHHFLPFFHVIGMPSAAKWSLKTSRSLCDWPKGGTWPMCGTKIVHWLKILPFLSGLKTKVRLRRPNFIRTQNIPLRGLSGVLRHFKSMGEWAKAESSYMHSVSSCN